jgi:hypothetical protein
MSAPRGAAPVCSGTLDERTGGRGRHAARFGSERFAWLFTLDGGGAFRRFWSSPSYGQAWMPLPLNSSGFLVAAALLIMTLQNAQHKTTKRPIIIQPSDLNAAS